ncbi:MAG TPA: hypothetical protein VE961_17070 [Pyrinomonadaceae bacterium]|nr:hypothetical protein [Pyrinomonadaceae bacterium]
MTSHYISKAQPARIVRLRLGLSLVVLLCAPLSLMAQPAQNVARDKEEYAVYSALIRNLYVHFGRRLMVIASPACCGELAVSRGFSQYAYKDSIPVSQEAFEDFRAHNPERLALQRMFDLPIPYVIDERAGLVRLVSGPENDYRLFHAKYPGAYGFIHLSRVGFNEKLDEAFVFTCEIFDRAFQACRLAVVSKNAGCEACWFVRLVKKNNNWRVMNIAFHDKPS